MGIHNFKGFSLKSESVSNELDKLHNQRIRQHTYDISIDDKIKFLYLYQRGFGSRLGLISTQAFPVLSTFLNVDPVLEPKNYYIRDEERHNIDRLVQKLYYHYTLELLPDFHDVDPIFDDIRDAGNSVHMDIKAGSRYSSAISSYAYTIRLEIQKKGTWQKDSGKYYFDFQEELHTIYDRLVEDFRVDFSFRHFSSTTDGMDYTFLISKKGMPLIA